MCSIIAANRQKEMELIFLENRDRPKELFIGNDVRKIGDVVGVYDFRAQGIACGYSLKTGVAGGVANILGYYGKKSRLESSARLCTSFATRILFSASKALAKKSQVSLRALQRNS